MVRDPDPSREAGLSAFLVEVRLLSSRCSCHLHKMSWSSGELPLQGLVSSRRSLGQGAQERGREFPSGSEPRIGFRKDSKCTTGFYSDLGKTVGGVFQGLRR